jgi:hypothetical protein
MKRLSAVHTEKHPETRKNMKNTCGLLNRAGASFAVAAISYRHLEIFGLLAACQCRMADESRFAKIEETVSEILKSTRWIER